MGTMVELANFAKQDTSARIRLARRLANISQQSLADRLGIRRAAVTHWESGRGTLPSTLNLLQTAIELNVCFEWLATGRGRMRPEPVEESSAFSMDCVAQSFEEEHMLSLFRRCNAKQRESLLGFLASSLMSKAR